MMDFWDRGRRRSPDWFRRTPARLPKPLPEEIFMSWGKACPQRRGVVSLAITLICHFSFEEIPDGVTARAEGSFLIIIHFQASSAGFWGEPEPPGSSF